MIIIVIVIIIIAVFSCGCWIVEQLTVSLSKAGAKAASNAPAVLVCHEDGKQMQAAIHPDTLALILAYQ